MDVKFESLPKEIQRVINIANYIYSASNDKIIDNINSRDLIFQEAMRAFRSLRTSEED